MKNTLLFICGTNILVRLLTANMKNCLAPCDPIIVNPVVKVRPHPARHIHISLFHRPPPPPGMQCVQGITMRAESWDFLLAAVKINENLNSNFL